MFLGGTVLANLILGCPQTKTHFSFLSRGTSGKNPANLSGSLSAAMFMKRE